MKTHKLIIDKTKHVIQPYVVTVDPHGKAEPYKLKQRYATKATARRGGLRNMKAKTLLGNTSNIFPVDLTYYMNGIRIEVIYK